MPVRRITPAHALLLREVRLRGLATDPCAFVSTYTLEAPRNPSAWDTWAREQASGADKATFLALRDGTVDAVGLAMGQRTEEPRRFGLFSMGSTAASAVAEPVLERNWFAKASTSTTKASLAGSPVAGRSPVLFA